MRQCTGAYCWRTVLQGNRNIWVTEREGQEGEEGEERVGVKNKEREGEREGEVEEEREGEG